MFWKPVQNDLAFKQYHRFKIDFIFVKLDNYITLFAFNISG